MEVKKGTFCFGVNANPDGLESHDLDAARKETPLVQKFETGSIENSLKSDATFGMEEIEHKMSYLLDIQNGSNAEDSDGRKFHHGNRRVSLTNVLVILFYFNNI